MLQLKNATPFAANMAIFPNEQGVDTLYTMVKATFIIGQSWTLADEQFPPQANNEYWGEPGISSIKKGSDFHTGKPQTDIIMLGNAYSPNGQMVKQLDVQLDLGLLSKTVRVIGDRNWQDGNITSPQEFSMMPIVFERAYGGQHQVDAKQIVAEERNPVGVGYLGKRTVEEMNGQPLPNIEDPNELIRELNDQPTPTGFSFCSPDWLPRRKFAGTYDDDWQNQHAPYLPLDFDNRFLNMAHPDLIYPGYVQGGESVYIKNMNANGDLSFVLPTVSVICDIDLQGKLHRPNMNMESLILEPNENCITMVWKASFGCDKKALKINHVEVKISR